MENDDPAAERRPKRRAARSSARRRAESAPEPSGEEEHAAVAYAQKRARGALISGSALALFGLGMVGVQSSDAGAAVVLVGLLVLIYGIHSFGRLGPETMATPGSP